MDYNSTLDGLEGFWNALTTCSEHQLGGWTIFHLLVKIRESWKLVMVVNKAPSSLKVDSQACHINGMHKYSGDR